MKQYRVDQVNKKLFNVLEIPTEMVIKSFTTAAEAHSFKRHLNKGGGFCGFTPTFILVKAA